MNNTTLSPPQNLSGYHRLIRGIVKRNMYLSSDYKLMKQSINNVSILCIQISQ